jgi:dienelactone hydrolase
MKNRSDVYPERMASIGWCFGGGWSYQIAKNNLGVKAGVLTIKRHPISPGKGPLLF